MNYLKKYEVPNFPKNSILKNIYVLDFCSEEDCNNIIKSAELSATFHKGWRTKRHGKYPTTDIPFSYLYQNKNNNWKQWLTNKVKEKIIPILNQYYNCTFIDFHDLFIVKYGGTDKLKALQKSLDIHRDAPSSLLSCVITLNEGYKGGGTIIESLGKTIEDQVLFHPIGSIAIHCGQLNHGAAEVSGDIPRYVCVGFMKIKAPWINRIAYIIPKDDLDDSVILNRLELYEDKQEEIINNINITIETYSRKNTKIKKYYLENQQENRWFYIEKILSNDICDKLCNWAKNNIDYKTLDTVDNKPVCECIITSKQFTNVCGKGILSSILIHCTVKLKNVHMIIRKYSSEENNRDSLNEHYDCSEETIDVALNYKSDYEGGELYFKFDQETEGLPSSGNKKYIPNIYNSGDVLIHNQYIRHGVNQITKGSRWALIIFLNHINNK